MAIKKFDGTTSGSDSGWTRRFYTEFTGTNGHAWRVEIIDSGSAAGTFSQSETTETHIDLGEGGFLIEYDGDNDNRRTPLVASSCSLEMICTDAGHYELVSAIHTNNDHRFGIAVFVFEPDSTDGTTGADLFADGNGWWRPFWFGTIFADQGEAEYLKTQAKFSVTAQCGLALLNDENFVKDNGDPYLDEATLAQQIGRCFDKLPTKSLWGWNDYDGSTSVNRDFNQNHVDRGIDGIPRVPLFRECVWIFDKDKHNDGSASILDNTGCSSMAFLEIAEDKDELGGIVRKRQFVSCSEVLEHIASVLGARLFLADGSWWFQNMDQMFDSTLDRYEFVYFDIYHLKVAGSANATNTPLENSVAASVLDLYGKGYSFTDEVKVNVLFPVRMVESIHVEGGSRVLAGTETAVTTYDSSTTGNASFGWQEQNIGIFYDKVSGEDTWECQPITFANEGANIEGGQNITITGGIRFHNLGQQHWTDNHVNSANAKGMRYLVRLTIKVGDYYLKRSVVNRSETAPIKNNIGTTIATQKFWEQDGDVEWTLTPDTYDFGLPRLGGDPEGATVELTDEDGPIDFDFVGGFHTENRGGNNTDQFKVVEGVVGNTMYGTYRYDLNWTLPELPESIVHEGLSLEFDMQIHNSENAFMTGTAVRDILDDGGASGGFGVGQGKEIGFLENFQIMYADGTSDVEVKFISLVDQNTTSIVTAESVLGDKYTETQTNRALKVLDANGGDSKWADGNWTTLDQPSETGKNIHQLLANETMEKRHKPLEIRSVNVAFTEHATVANPLSTGCGNHSVATWKVPSFARVFKVANTNGVNEWLQPLEMSFSPNETEMTLAMVKTSRDLTSVTNVDNTDQVRGPQGGGGSPLGTLSTQPVNIGRNPLGGGSTSGAISALRRLQTGTNNSISAIQTKTDFISVSATGVTNITGDGTFVRATNVQTDANRSFATQTQLNAIASNTLQSSANAGDISTNAGNISTNASSITDIETKTDLLTVTGATNLDSVRNKAGAITINASNEITSLNVSGASVMSIDNVTDGSTRVALLATERSQKLNNILGLTTGIAGFAVAPGFKPLTADQVNDASTTAKFTNADGVTKLDNMTLNANDKIESLDIAGAYGGGTRTMDLGQMHDLMAGNYPSGTCPTTYGYLCTIAQSVNDAATANRSGQTGNVVALIDTDGKFLSLADGVSGQFLKTDGSGNLSWGKTESGWHNSATNIKVMFHQFIMNDDYNRAPVMVEDDTTGKIGIKMPAAASEAFAPVAIPLGYKATHVQVFASASTSSAVEALDFDHTNGDVSSLGTGAFNSSIDITDLTSGATANLVIKIIPASAVTIIYGANVTIEKTS